MATAEQIATWAGGSTSLRVDGLCRVSAVEAADATSVVFATSAPALALALASAAGLILVSDSVDPAACDARLVRVSDARLAFAQVAHLLRPVAEPTIHPTAIISPSAVIGRGVTLHAGAVVGEGVTLGDGCSIGARAVLEAGVVLGQRVRVQAGAVIGSQGFGYVRQGSGAYLLFPQQGTLVIEDDVDIGANTTIDRGALGETRIGAGAKIDNLVHIGHNCRIGRNVIIAAQTGISGSSVVEDGAILGGQVGIGEHANVGHGVILGGGAGVLSGKKVRGPGQVFWGRPARPLKQYLRDLARLSRGR